LKHLENNRTFSWLCSFTCLSGFVSYCDIILNIRKK
jgi:hypothetical protein